MSFILDALKKSEMERQRQATPGLVESDIARPRSRLPLWAIALGALLAVNLVVLVVVLTRSSSGAPPVTAAARDSAPAHAPAPVTATNDRAPAPFSPLDTPAEYAPEIPAAGGPVAGAARPAPAPVQSKPAADVPAAVRTPHHHDPVLANDDYKADEENLPTVNEITQPLPDLHLDVHVYATQPADRFVFINMRKYHEGATLQEGPTIEHIRRDGVVMTYQGLRFLLPRQ